MDQREIERTCRAMDEQMVRIAIVPYDFGAGRMPGFLTELANRAGV